ncbi:hypothetical protein ACSSS7_005760 [Eimeria intestinalis]
MARVQVHQLSGGWKRRLSSSVAFLGNPTVVFLDEPTAGDMSSTKLGYLPIPCNVLSEAQMNHADSLTRATLSDFSSKVPRERLDSKEGVGLGSQLLPLHEGNLLPAWFCAGMDIMYRRTFWDSVRGLSKGRSIILITHMMEEADYLCDRVGIMASGSIVCSGTALSLKNRLVDDSTDLTTFSGQGEIKFFPWVAQLYLRFAFRLFSELEGSGARFGVGGLVLSFASLEEVFLNVTRLATQSPNCAEVEISSAPNSREAVQGQAEEAVGSPASLQEQVNPNEPTFGGVGLSQSSATSVRQSSGGALRRSHVGTEHATQEDDVPPMSDASAPCLSSSIENSFSAHLDSKRSLLGAALLEASKYDDSLSRRIIKQARIMRALVVKRLKLVYRDWALLMVSFVIPLLLMGLTLYLRIDKSEPRVPLSGRQLFEYRLPRSVHAQVPYGGTGGMLGALDRCHSVSRQLPGRHLVCARSTSRGFCCFVDSTSLLPLVAQKHEPTPCVHARQPYMRHDNVSNEVQTNDEMYEFLLSGYFGPHPPRFGAYVVHGSEADLSDTADQLEATIWHNSTLRDSVPLYYNHLLNCLAEDRTGVAEAVLASNQPFEDNDDKFMDGVVVAFFTVISFSFVAAGVGQICIEERVRKVRHQQILAGVTPLQYWLSAYIVDFLLLVIPCSLIYGLLVWTDISPLVGSYQRPAFLLSMVLFCLSVCPLGYAISAAVDSPMTFVMVMLLLGWSLPSVQALFTEVSGVKGIYAAFLRYIFMFLPHAAVCEPCPFNLDIVEIFYSIPVKRESEDSSAHAPLEKRHASDKAEGLHYENRLSFLLLVLLQVLTNLVLMKSLASGTMKASELVNWLDFQKIGCPLLYLGVTIVTNWIICIAIDSSTNYPMGEPRIKAFFNQALDAFRACFHVATCRGVGVRQRWLTRNVSAGSSAGAPSTIAAPNQVDFQYPQASGSRQAVKKCSHLDGLGLHLQEEEARAAEAVCRLRQRPRKKVLASAPQRQLQDSCGQVEAGEERAINVVSPMRSSSSVTKMDQPDPVLVVYRLQKTYTASLLQRCSCSCGSACCDWASCRCCKQTQSINALKGISFCVDKGSCFAYIGSQMRQSGGSVFVDGWDALTHPEKTRAKLRYCPQTDALLPALTGAEHVYFYGCLLGLSGSQLSKFCEEFFATIGCNQYMHRPVKSYSGGTKRKLSLGLALLGSVDLLLLDEPTNGVDPESRHLLWKMIEDAKSCKTAGKAILLTSHSMEECEVLCDKVGIIYKGEMLCVGTPTEIRATHGRGYQIECVFFTSAVALEPLLPRRFISTLLAKFPRLHVVRWMAYKVTASIPKNDASLAAIFCEIEAIKASAFTGAALNSALAKLAAAN